MPCRALVFDLMSGQQTVNQARWNLQKLIVTQIPTVWFNGAAVVFIIMTFPRD